MRILFKEIEVAGITPLSPDANRSYVVEKVNKIPQ